CGAAIEGREARPRERDGQRDHDGFRRILPGAPGARPHERVRGARNGEHSVEWRHRRDAESRPAAGRARLLAARLHPAASRLWKRGRRHPDAGRGDPRDRGWPWGDLRTRASDRRLAVRAEHRDAHRPRRRDRLLALHRESLPRGARPRQERRRCGRHRARDGRSGDPVLWHHGRHRSRGDAFLPGHVPGIAWRHRLARRRGRRPLRAHLPSRSALDIRAARRPHLPNGLCVDLQLMPTDPHITLLSGRTASTPQSDAALAIVRPARAQTVDGGTVLVTGQTAFDVDTVDYLVDHTPITLGFVTLTTMLALFLLLGSVLLPLNAVALNALSVCASFVALVWIL